MGGTNSFVEDQSMSNSQQHILAIGGHIGDAEITAGLLITKYAAAGHRATILHMTAGEKGNPRMDHQEYRRQRVAEAQAAATKMGAAECIVLEYPDGELHANQETIEQMCDLVRRLRPDIVLPDLWVDVSAARRVESGAGGAQCGADEFRRTAIRERRPADTPANTAAIRARGERASSTQRGSPRLRLHKHSRSVAGSAEKQAGSPPLRILATGTRHEL
jgi:hypothetical protein